MIQARQIAIALVRAYQIVLAALIAARDLPTDQRRKYTTMILDAASKTMHELLQTKWNELYPDDELSDWEKEGASYQVKVRMRLDVTQLPKPFQVNAINDSDWHLSSGWKTFTYKAE